jgi:hypothetical protein
MKTILEYITPDQIFFEPFPHIVAHNVLPSDIYAALSKNFPDKEVVLDGADYISNQRFDYTLKQIREGDNVSQVWKEFCEVNASPQFLEKVIEIFGESIYKIYPHFSTSHMPLEDMRPGVRYVDEYTNADIMLDAHISINTPVYTKPSTVRVAHVDDPRKLYGALLYVRAEDDMTEGGDLEIYRYKKVPYRFYGQHVDAKYIEKIKTIPYKANTFVFFINSIDSLHGVSVRNKTNYTRQFCNFIGQLKDPLFDITSLQEGWLQKKYRYYKAKVTNQGGKW